MHFFNFCKVVFSVVHFFTVGHVIMFEIAYRFSMASVWIGMPSAMSFSCSNYGCEPGYLDAASGPLFLAPFTWWIRYL